MTSKGSEPTLPTQNRRPVSGRDWMPPIRFSGHLLALAEDVSELEACLHLELSAPGMARLFGGDSEGIESPSAIPYCDFLMIRDPAGRLAGVCRLLVHGPDIPVRNPLVSDRFHRGPLLTAIRYSRLDILEVGPLAIDPGSSREALISLLWMGILRYVDRRGLALVLGKDRMPVDSKGPAVPRLMAAYGLHPDLELEAREAFRSGTRSQGIPGLSGSADPGLPTLLPALLPAGLRAALGQGARLAGEPVLNAEGNSLDLVWVASREMLDAGADWRRNVPTPDSSRPPSGPSPDRS